METFSALLVICAGNSPAAAEFPAQRSVTRSIDVFFDLRLNKRFSKQWWGWWFETPPRPLWRHGLLKWPCDACGWMLHEHVQNMAPMVLAPSYFQCNHFIIIVWLRVKFSNEMLIDMWLKNQGILWTNVAWIFANIQLEISSNNHAGLLIDLV